MKTIHSLSLALTTSLLIAPLAFAQPIDPAQPLDPATQAELVAEAEDADVDRHCLRHTGSRLLADPDADTDADTDTGPGKADSKRSRCAIASGRVYTRDDLNRTGHMSIGEALRALDPGIH